MLDDSISGNTNQPETHKTKSLNFGGPVKLIASTVAIFFVSQIVITLLAMLIGWLLGYNIKETFDYLAEQPLGQFLTVLGVEVLTIGFVWLVLKKYVKNPLKVLGIGRFGWREVKWLVGSTVLFYVAVILVGVLLYTILPQIDIEQKQQLGFDENLQGTYLLLTFFALVILAPLAEEILMRGYLFTGLRKVMRFLPSALLVSTLFAAAHLQIGSDEPPLWTAGITTFVLSMVLVYTKEKTGSLWPAIGLHVINNFVAFSSRFIFN